MAHSVGEQLANVQNLLNEEVANLDDLGEADLDNDGTGVSDDEDQEHLEQEIDEEDAEEDGESEEESEDESQDDDSEEDENEGEITNLSELAESLDADEAALYGLEVPMGDGRDPVTIGELKDSYTQIERTRSQIERDRLDLQAERDGFVESQESIKQLPMFNNELMAAAIEVKSIQNTMEQIDWDAFENDNASQAIAYRGRLERAMNEAQQSFKAVQGKIKQVQDQNKQKLNAYNREKTLEKIPDWADSEVFTKDSAKIGKVLTEFGFSPGEISSISDYRFSVMLKEFVELREGKVKAKESVTKLKKIPKRLKGISKTGQSSIKQAKTQSLMKTAKASKDNRVKAAAISELIS